MNNITITEEVILTIAGIATKEVEGVAGLHTGVVDTILDKFKGKNFSGGVSAEVTEENIKVSVIIDVYYGEKIYEVAKNVQKHIKATIEDMTERKVSEINVHVHGVSLPSSSSEK